MPTLAILDDRKEQRETLVRNLKRKVPKTWKCLEAPLAASVEQYPRWCVKNHVAVLLIDERLNEQHGGNEPSVSYKGHEVIIFLRKTLPNLPIFVVTSFENDADLVEHEAQAEAIINRRKLTNAQTVDTHVSRFIRAGQRFVEEHEKQLADLTALSQKSASGRASGKDIEKLKAIQTTLQLPLLEEANPTRIKLLSKLEDQLKEIEKLASKIKKRANG